MKSTRARQTLRLPLLAAALLSLAVPSALSGRGAPNHPVNSAPPVVPAPGTVGLIVRDSEFARWKTGRGAPRHPRPPLPAAGAAGLGARQPSAALDNTALGDADIIITDFEFARWRDAGWTVSGAAFGIGPSEGAIGRQRPIHGLRGKRLASSHLGAGDQPIGAVTSPEFSIYRPYINLLVGAGGWAGRTCVNLVVNGKIVRAATGDNISERLEWKTWDVSEFAGQSAMIRILDAATGKWGHINVDQITQSATPAAQPLAAGAGGDAAAPGKPDITVTDFEFASWADAGWTTTGAAFGDGPLEGTATLGQGNPVTGYNGRRLVYTYINAEGRGDGHTGALTSPEFAIQRQYMHLLVGGGARAGEACVNLVINGKTVRTATGANDETLRWVTWDVSKFAGQKAVIKILDEATGGWGHINVDDITQSDSAIPAQ